MSDYTCTHRLVLGTEGTDDANCVDCYRWGLASLASERCEGPAGPPMCDACGGFLIMDSYGEIIGCDACPDCEEPSEFEVEEANLDAGWDAEEAAAFDAAIPDDLAAVVDHRDFAPGTPPYCVQTSPAWDASDPRETGR